MRTKEICVAAVPAIALSLAVGAAHGGGNVLLDVPDGVHGTTNFTWSSAQPVDSWDFEPSSENIYFHGSPDWGSPGVLFIKGNGASGAINFTAEAGSSISLSSFDFTGWLSAAASLDFDFLVDDQLVYSDRLQVAGAVDLTTLDLSQFSGSEIRLEFSNVGTSRVGLDNFVIESTPVPAPGALALLGLAGVAGSRRRRR